MKRETLMTMYKATISAIKLHLHLQAVVLEMTTQC
jgi:hypothetical protein